MSRRLWGALGKVAAAWAWLGGLEGPAAGAQELDPFTVGGLVPEVVSRAEAPHVADWRLADWELGVAYGYVDEANNFATETYELALGLPTGSGSMTRFGLRRAQLYGTPSSKDLGRTPFRQEALETRYEPFMGLAYGLLEGRSMTRLSPKLPDFGHAMFAWGGLHYHHPNASWVPRRKEPPPPLPGQSPARPKMVLELGLRWHVQTPQSLGFSFEATHQRPLGGGTGRLKSWAYFSGGVLWAFGVR